MPEASRRVIVMPVIVVALGAIFAAQSFAGPMDLSIQAAGLVKSAVHAGEWWRLITAPLLHASFRHVAFTVAVLIPHGLLLEGAVGRNRLLLVFGGACLAGSAAGLLWSPSDGIVGSTGGALGLASFSAVMAARRRPGLAPQVVSRATLPAVILIAVGLFKDRSFDPAASLGGALAGAALGWLSIPREGETEDPEASIRVVGWAAAVLLVAGAGGAAWRVVDAGLARRAEIARRHDADGITPITSVVAGIDIVLGSQAHIQITSKTSKTIDAWAIEEFKQPDDLDPALVTIQDGCCQHAVSKTNPIGPHETRTVVYDERNVPPQGKIINGARPFPTDRPPTPEPRLRLGVIVFDDLSYEGSRRERDLILGARARVGAAAELWLGMLNDALAAPAGQGQATLKKRFGSIASGRPGEPGFVFRSDLSLLLYPVDATADRFVADATHEASRLIAQRDALDRVPAGMASTSLTR